MIETDSDIDSFLFTKITDSDGVSTDHFHEHYLEQYRIYLHVFNSTIDRSQRSNEFFLGLNTAIIGVLGYIESKGNTPDSVILVLVPLVGICICVCWYKIICAYKQLNRNKFKVIHKLEKKLPVALFETEWELLGRGKDHKKYVPLSTIEKYIPIIFSILYIIFFIISFPWHELSRFSLF